MRITQSMIVRSTLQYVNINRDRLHDIQEAVASQKKVRTASDDPVGFSRIARYRLALAQNGQFMNNVQNARGWIDSTTHIMEQFQDLVLQAKDIAAQGADGSADGELRQTLAHNVRGILDEAVALANSKYLGKSQFAGTNTKNDQPFTLSGTTVTYSGNEGAIKRKVSEDMELTVNVHGQEIMDTGVFDSLSQLIRGLENNDTSQIQNAMENLTTAKENLFNITTRGGSLSTQLKAVENRLMRSDEDLRSYISQEEDVKLEEALVRMKNEEFAYQAALQSAAHISQMNIMNFLR